MKTSTEVLWRYPLRRIQKYIAVNRKLIFFGVLAVIAGSVVYHLLHRHFVSPPLYSIRNLGLHDLTPDFKVAINNQGHVTGTVLVAPNWPKPPVQNIAFLDRGGTIISLGTLSNGGESTSTSINDQDEIVGTSTLKNGSSSAFLWRNGKMKNLGFDAQELFINNHSQIACTIQTQAGRRAAIWDNGKTKFLPSLGADSFALGINNQGIVAGNASSAEGEEYTVLWSNGDLRKLTGFLTSPYINISGINDRQQIIGDTGDDAVIRQNGSVRTLGSLGGESVASSINNLGQVVGWSGRSWWSSITDYYGSRHAFLWQKGELFDLNDYLPTGSGWKLREATGINDHGQIVGDGIFNNQPCSFLLTPVQ